MKVVLSPKCVEYATPGHPEAPARIESIFQALKDDYQFVLPEPASREDILRAHTKTHFERVMEGSFMDADTPPINPEFPLLSAGAAIDAMSLKGFAITRPPGHHAGRDFLGGFCYFNNVAIAVKKAGVRTAILDLDVHHGNGTQDIFLGEKDVLFASLHQSPHYPGTGLKSESNCLNYPLPAGTDEKAYMKTLQKAIAEITRFKPELLAVSMGFDTYKGDTLSGIMLREGSYALIGKSIKELSIPTFVALEGGYSSNLGELVRNFLDAF